MAISRVMIAAAVGFALLAAGCATPMEVSSISEIKATNGATGIDVHSLRRQKGEQVPEFAGDQLLDVRTYRYEDGKGEYEFAGANCLVSGSEYQANVVTPARVRVPLYRAQSSALSVSCTKDGLEKKSIVVEAYDEVRASRLSSGANGGLIGVAIAAGADALSDNTKNAWKYRPARVVMTAVEKKPKPQ
jgi:hypothetical protein